LLFLAGLPARIFLEARDLDRFTEGTFRPELSAVFTTFDSLTFWMSFSTAMTAAPTRSLPTLVRSRAFPPFDDDDEGFC
jgi:hypothetical protein